jgi:hypothetical protein
VRSELNDRIVVCGGAPASVTSQQQKVTDLFISGPRKNVNLRIDDISKSIAANLPDTLVDLIEIAAYVYSADQAVTRGGDGVQNVGKLWRRDFRFFIPVREPAVWMHRHVNEALTDALSFVSEDTYSFTFSQLANPTPVGLYLEGAVERCDVEQVMLFSGGLDSLAGAVQESVIDRRRVAFVSHRSTPKIDNPQRALVADFSKRCRGSPALHVPVWINKDKALGVEVTQRTRSFLFSSLGMVVARMFGLSSVRFYENGVTSLNLPISEQLVGAKASRTTHPQALNAVARLFGVLLQQTFSIENPFIWSTKAEVVNLIGGAGCKDLIQMSVSCIHTIARTTEHTHCGKCSQCIARRFATLASDFGDADPREKYKIDLLTGTREDKRDVTVVESVIRIARAMTEMTDREFFQRFGEASRVINHLPGTADEVAKRILDLHRRYGREVKRVLAAGLREYADDFHAGRLPPTCAIALAVPPIYKGGSVDSSDATAALDERLAFRKHLSADDQKLFNVIGEQQLKSLSNPEILARTSIMRAFDPAFSGSKRDAIRARLNRIRKYFNIPTPATTPKKTDQSHPTARSARSRKPAG